MIKKFEALGREYEGEILAGEEAMQMFHKATSALVEAGFFLGQPMMQSIAKLAILPGAEKLAKETLDGWTCDGVKIDKKSWSELFNGQRRFFEPYAVCVRVWSESGFLGE